ncbi:MAG: hypothetical protein ACYTKD_08885 [Planctomycetota bacterium]
MLFSYVWPADLAGLEAAHDSPAHPLVGRYVRLHRPENGKWSRYWRGGDGLGDYLDNFGRMMSNGDEPAWVTIKGLPEGVSPEIVHGRVVAETRIGSVSMRFLGVDAAASRWTGASVAGLVVGAMGIFIFALHLRRWMRVRGPKQDA